MGSGVTGTLDEAYQRLHATGPEFGGWLPNHGPMAAEAMVRRGHAGRVHRWLDGYMRRLEEFPRGSGPIGPGWQEALGNPRRVADWTAYFRREVADQPWRQVLGTWWPGWPPPPTACFYRIRRSCFSRSQDSWTRLNGEAHAAEACASPFTAGRDCPRSAGYPPADRTHHTE
jgi:hypothetical protein